MVSEEVAHTILTNITVQAVTQWCENLRPNATAKGISAMFISWTTRFFVKSFMVVTRVLTGNYVANDPENSKETTSISTSATIFYLFYVKRAENISAPKGIYFHVCLLLFFAVKHQQWQEHSMVSLSFAFIFYWTIPTIFCFLPIRISEQ